jgi:hypothetical protein
MYKNDDKVVFTTLAIQGPQDNEQRYKTCVRTQIESILKFTHNRAIIITDAPEEFGNEYGPRITFVKFDDTLTPLTPSGALGQFQYSLKAIPIRYTMEHYKPDVIVWLDADAFLFGWNQDFYKTFNDDQETMYGRMRANISHPNTDPIILKKVRAMGYNPDEIHQPVAIESVLIFKTGPKLINLMDTWERLALKAYNLKLNSDYESVDLAIACHEHNYNCKIITASFPHTDNFRLLHDRKIFTPFV